MREKSLLLEKPLAMNEEDAREIVQTALKKDRQLVWRWL